MQFPFYLYLKKPQNYYSRERFGVRVTKELQTVQPNEVVVKMIADIPDALFTRPSLSASITIPADVAPEEIKAETIDNIKQTLEQSLDLKIKFNVEEEVLDEK